MNIGVIGLGLIGGSVALALKKNGQADRVMGADRNKTHCEEALTLGIVDEINSVEYVSKYSDIIVLAIPVKAASLLVSKILNDCQAHAVVLDMGSTKAGICEAVANHRKRGNFVAVHPIAGTENSGPSAAVPNLMMDKIVIICEKEKSSTNALSTAEKLLKSLFMEIHYMTASEHDKHIAFVSHLSHVTSFALGLTVLKAEKDEKNIFNMAGSGFDSTARLAKSSPEMWSSIFSQNRTHLLKAVQAYIDQMNIFKEALEKEQDEKLYKLMETANEIRRVLNK